MMISPTTANTSPPQLQLTRRYLRVVRHRLPGDILALQPIGSSSNENGDREQQQRLALQENVRIWIQASLEKEFGKNNEDEEKKKLADEHESNNDDHQGTLDVQPVEWLPPWTLCYSIPKHVFLSQWSLHQMGAVIGMDPSSIATVVSLLQTPSSSQLLPPTAVLDTCCSPGMKTALIAELLHASPYRSRTATTSERAPPAVVVGVDVSLNRLFTARSLLPKLLPSSSSLSSSPSSSNRRHVDVILSHADSTRFDPTQLRNHVSQLTKHSIIGKSAVDGAPIKSAHLDTWKLKKQLQVALRKSETADSIPSTSSFVWCSDGAEARLFRQGEEEDDGNSGGVVPTLYSHVLVDVECTHDGSLSHIVVEGGENSGVVANTNKNTTTTTTTYQDGMHKYKPNYALHTDVANSNTSSLSLTTTTTTRHVNGDKRNRDDGANTAASLSSEGGGGGQSTSLHDLQLGILTQAYNLLAPNGTLVYSTCSFSELQNEKLVEEFMEQQQLHQLHSDEDEDVTISPCYYYPRIIPPFEDEQLMITQEGNDGNTSEKKPSSSSWFSSLKAVCQETHIRDASGKSLGMGVRLDPRQTGSSFQYIVKLVKYYHQ